MPRLLTEIMWTGGYIVMLYTLGGALALMFYLTTIDKNESNVYNKMRNCSKYRNIYIIP